MKMHAKPKMSGPQFRALQSAVDHDDATRHLRGQSQWGGWEATRAALQRRGWLDCELKVTDAGRAALTAWRGVP